MGGGGTIVIHQVLDDVDVRHEHASATIALEAKLLKGFARRLLETYLGKAMGGGKTVGTTPVEKMGIGKRRKEGG